MSEEIIIRTANSTDIPAITRIYNHYVRETHITFDLTEKTETDRAAWLEQFTGNQRHQLIVGEVDGSVIGYACSGTFRTKPAYDRSVETTIYLDHTAGGKGYGLALYQHLIDSLSQTDVHRCYGVIALPNDASVALHRRLGFVEKGRLTEVGFKFDRYWDTLWMERSF